MVLRNAWTIQLQRTWILDQEIAQGGFGKIYAARGEQDEPAVVKLIPKAPGASRELLFESIASHPNIIPIWDTGEWESFYVLVMPRAEKSLRQHLLEAGGKLTLQESLAILIDVAEALAGLEREVVHRDLKPENILFYQDHWCLADFGIARYAEATTAPDTRKHSFTYPYAAPEQWRHERATPQTDVYAFGVTAFELLQGRRPFSGPSSSDYQEQHLMQMPPSLGDCPPRVAALVTECLIKAQPARPMPANILVRLRQSQTPSSPAVARLQAVNQQIVGKLAQAEASASAERTVEKQRRDLFNAAQQSLEFIREKLAEQIQEAAPSASVLRSPYLRVQIGDGSLTIEAPRPAPANCLALPGHKPPFDVIAQATIEVRKPRDRYNYEGRAHSLWFCDAHDEGVYRWFETAFMRGVFYPYTTTVNPFALAPTEKNAIDAFSPTMADCQIAWQPLPFDQGDEEQFLERWLGWVAEAASGTLQSPRSMPEQSGGHYRNAR